MMTRFLFACEGLACKGGAVGSGAVVDAPQFVQNLTPTGVSAPHLEQNGKFYHLSTSSFAP